jgi:hypothetical protein
LNKKSGDVLKKQRLHTFLSAILTITASLTFIVLGQAPASADHIDWPIADHVHIERDVGVKTSKPNSDDIMCVHNYYTDVCLKPYGDVLYVKDMVSDGKSAAFVWENMWYDDNGYGHVWRQGVCRNPHGAGTWAKCNKDYHENYWLAMSPATVDGSDWHLGNGAVWWRTVPINRVCGSCI